VVAFDGGEAVGCSTCVRLAEEDDGLRAPFVARGIDPGRVFYFGESVLLPAYRGQGAGVAFFAAREAHARSVSDCDLAAFCAVERPASHPLRPADAVPLDAFWRRRGFTRIPNLACTMAWKQMDGPGEVTNRLVFWLKSLTGAALP
jgi:GNAT superfamily N-acetyltransferase